MRRDSLKKFSRSKQRAKLLIANPDFQQEVKLIRTKFNIPLDGIKSNEESQEWHHQFYESHDIYLKTNRVRVREEIKKLDHEKKFSEGFDLHTKFNNEDPVNALNIAIKFILKRYKLPLNWLHSVQRYILFNSIDLMWVPGNVIVHQEIDQDTDLRKLSIEIDDTTTLDDLKHAWPLIKFHQKKLESYVNQKIQPIKHFERDQKAYLLKKEGKTPEEIEKAIQDEFDITMNYDDINKAITRYKKRVGIN